MKRLVSFCMLILPMAVCAQMQYYLPTASSSDADKDKPMIEVYLPQQPNGCAVVLCAALDAKAAIRMVREHADEWHISKNKIGYLGFSAGGGVALFMEWKKAGANAELHVYGDGKGPYELMLQTGETTTETWSSQMIQWLKSKGLFSK